MYIVSKRFPGVDVSATVDSQHQDLNGQDEEVACYGVALATASFQKDLEREVSVDKGHGGEVEKESLIQAMYSLGKLKTFNVDRIMLKLMESKALLKLMSISRPGFL